jgi:hypothetical protein
VGAVEPKTSGLSPGGPVGAIEPKTNKQNVKSFTSSFVQVLGFQ